MPAVPDLEVRTIADRQVAATVDATSPTQIYRDIRDDRWSIDIITADTPMWTDDLTALTPNRDVQSDNAAVTIDVPAGWTSLGDGRMQRSWTMDLRVDVDGAIHVVHLAQVPNAPVGFLLSGESNPTPFDHNGQTWWAVDIVTTPGITSIIGHTGFGAPTSPEHNLPRSSTRSPRPRPTNSPRLAPADTAMPDADIRSETPPDTAARGDRELPGDGLVSGLGQVMPQRPRKRALGRTGQDGQAEFEQRRVVVDVDPELLRRGRRQLRRSERARVDHAAQLGPAQRAHERHDGPQDR